MSSSSPASVGTGMSWLTSLEKDLLSAESTELRPTVSTELRPAVSSLTISVLHLPRAVRGLGTGLDTVLPAALASSISTSLAELGGREVKMLSGGGTSSLCRLEILSARLLVLGPSAVDLRPRAGLGLGLVTGSSGSVLRPGDLPGDRPAGL